MLQLTISPEALQELVAVLEEYMSELRMEIADTDSYEYKGVLKQEKAVLVDLLKRLKELKPA